MRPWTVFLSLLLLVSLGGCSSESEAPAAADAGSSANDGCRQGASCAAYPTSDGTCSGKDGSCGCDGSTYRCGAPFIVSGCTCGTSCESANEYCTSCDGRSYKTCRCLGGTWTPSHGTSSCGGNDGGTD